MTRYISLTEFLWLAEQVTLSPAETLAKSSRLDLADPALHAPSGESPTPIVYPDVYDKATVMTCRLARNHAFEDACRRTKLPILVSDIGDSREGDIPTFAVRFEPCSRSRLKTSTCDLHMERLDALLHRGMLPAASGVEWRRHKRQEPSRRRQVSLITNRPLRSSPSTVARINAR